MNIWRWELQVEKGRKEFDRHIVVKKYLLEANQIMNK